MKITCIKCQAVYSIDDAMLAGGGIKAQCPACKDIQVVKLPDQHGDSAAAPAPRPDLFANLPMPPGPVLETEKSADEKSDPFADLELDQPGEPPTGPAQPAVQPSADRSDPFADLELDQPGEPPTGPVQPAAQPPPPLPGGRAASVHNRFSDIGERPAGPGKSPDDMPPLPAMETSAPTAAPAKGTAELGICENRCERCGAIVNGPGSADGLCKRCRGLAAGALGKESEREYRVCKTDGVILGPLTETEVKEKYNQGEITASDKVARGERDFRLISSYPEFSFFFRRPGDSLKPVFRHAPPSNAKRNLLIVLALLLVGGAVALFFLWPTIVDSLGPEEGTTSVVEDALEAFSLELPNPTGTSVEAVVKGRELMLRDERLGYAEADLAFKAALILDPTNLDAYAGWVQNRALLDYGAGEVSQRKVALDLIEHALERSPNMPSLLRAKAYLLFSLGQMKESRELANRALALQEDDPETQLILGATYLESSTELSVDLFRKALEGNKDINLAYRMLGEAKIRLGKFQEALKFFKRHLRKDPGQYASLDAMARVYLAVGKFDKARDEYEKILGGEPYRIDAAVSLCRLQYQFLGRQRSALKLIDGLIEAEDLDIGPAAQARLLNERSVVLRLQGKLDKANQANARALKLDPMLIPALYSQAWLSLRGGDVGIAIARFRALRAHLPKSSRVLLHIAEAEAQVPNYEAALKQFRLAVEADPTDLDAYLMLATMYLELDNPTQAYAWLRRATNVDPFRVRTHRALTACYDGPDLLRSTLERAKNAAQKYGDDPLAQALAGAVFWHAGQNDQAQARFLRALGLDDECFAANLYLGALLLGKGQPRRALPYLQQAHDSDSLHRVAGVMLAYAYLQTGKSKKAEKHIEAVFNDSPGDLPARLCLAEIQLARKQRKAGIESLLNVYESDEYNIRAKELLFNLGY